MSKKTKGILKQWFTEADNETWCLFRALAVLAVLTGLGLMVFSVGWSKPFSMMDFGTGVGALLAGVGVALKLKPETPQ